MTKNGDGLLRKGQFDSIKEKLASIIRKEFAGEFKFINASAISRNLREELIEKQSSIVSEDGVYFPVFSGSVMAGASVVSSDHPLSQQEIERLGCLLEITLESAAQSLAQLDKLHRREEYRSRMAALKSSNVIDLRQVRKNRMPMHLMAPIDRNPRSFSALIEGPDLCEAKKLALELHHRSFRFAFVSIYDINPLVFEEPQQLGTFGEVTLFIPNLAELTRAQQKGLMHFLTSDREESTPQFIACTQYSVKELIEHWGLSPKLIELLSTAHMKMTKKFSEYEKGMMLDLFHEGLSFPPSHPNN